MTCPACGGTGEAPETLNFERSRNCERTYIEQSKRLAELEAENKALECELAHTRFDRDAALELASMREAARDKLERE